MSASSQHTGWYRDWTNSRLDFYYNGTRGGHINASGASFTGTLAVTGATTLSSTLSATTVTATAGTITSGVSGSQVGSLVLGSTGSCGSTLTLTAAVCTDGVSFTLPAADGSCGQQLTTDGCGALSFAAASLGKYKTDLGALCKNEALSLVMSTPVHRFKYDRTKLPKGYWGPEYEMTGVFGEEAPWAMQGKNKDVFSPLNSVGTLTAAVQALAERLEAVEA